MAFCVTKAAVVMLAKNVSLPLAWDNICVDTVSPGWMWSDNIDKRYGGYNTMDLEALDQPMRMQLAPSRVILKNGCQWRRSRCQCQLPGLGSAQLHGFAGNRAGFRHPQEAL